MLTVFPLHLTFWWADDQYWDLLGFHPFPRTSSRPVSLSLHRMSAFLALTWPWPQKPWTCSIYSRSRSRSRSSDQWVETLGYWFYSVLDSTFRCSLITKCGSWNPGRFSVTVTDKWNSITDFVPSFANWYAQLSVHRLKSPKGHVQDDLIDFLLRQHIGLLMLKLWHTFITAAACILFIGNV